VSYFPMKSKRIDQTLGPDWGAGEEIFLEFLVQDTGRGLSAEELKLLFQRFSQASPRTHVQYGGSGLGLFISRELTELQGGEIGVSSEAGKGSTFAFYIKGRRSSEPKEVIDSVPVATGALTRKVSNAREGTTRTTQGQGLCHASSYSQERTTKVKQRPRTNSCFDRRRQSWYVCSYGRHNLNMSLTLHSQSESPSTPASESWHKDDCGQPWR
jgi:hypothetical protein